MKTAVVRIPIEDVREIEKIANDLKLTFPIAYRLWKQKKNGIIWENF